MLIYNNGSKAAYSTNYTRLIQQAKDVDGKWKPIEFFANSPSCLVYAKFYEHVPKRYSALSIIKYHGNFKTKIRVKIEIARHVYYSNEINGFINRTQFDQTMARNVLRFYCQFCDGSAPVSEERLAFAFLENKR